MEKKQYLPNLNPLRFLAASLVIFYHVEHALTDNHYKSIEYNFFPFNFGDTAVTLFFVLSGFLITYLLLKEKREQKSINIKRFYLKRIFRIWPLYYLIVMVSFAFFNHHPFFFDNSITNRISFNHPVLYSIFLLLIAPNILLLKVRSLGYASPTWSIGIEEQFYLIWPWLMRKKNYLFYILTIILIMFLLNAGFLQLISKWLVSIHIIHKNSAIDKLLLYGNKFFTFWASFRIDAMAIGAVGAYLVTYKNPLVVNTLFSKKFQIVMYGITIILFVFKDITGYQFYSLLFMLIIINLACNKQSLISLNNKFLDYLGTISYGIYMYHSFFVMPAIKFVVLLLPGEINMATELLIDFIVICGTVIISALSYHYLESYFLRLKERLWNEKN